MYLSMLYLIIIFIAVFGLSMVLIHKLVPNKTQQRLKSLTSDTEPGNGTGAEEWIARVVKMSGPLARLSIPDEGWRKSSLRTRFMHAGFRDSHVPTIFFAAKTALAVALPLLSWLALSVFGVALGTDVLLLCLLLGAAIGYYLPNMAMTRLIQRRQREIFENFPNALDLMTVCIEAGLTIDAAIGRVAHEMSSTCPVLSEELHLVTLELRAGNSKEKALRNLAQRTGVADVDTLATMLIQAEQFGTSIGDSLRVHSEHLRTRRRQLAEERAAKIALKLLMPLIFCIFPALMLIMLGPAMLQIYRVLLPSMGGQ